jgi:hypothetical protein
MVKERNVDEEVETKKPARPKRWGEDEKKKEKIKHAAKGVETKLSTKETHDPDRQETGTAYTRYNSEKRQCRGGG